MKKLIYTLFFGIVLTSCKNEANPETTMREVSMKMDNINHQLKHITAVLEGKIEPKFVNYSGRALTFVAKDTIVNSETHYWNVDTSSFYQLSANKVSGIVAGVFYAQRLVGSQYISIDSMTLSNSQSQFKIFHDLPIHRIVYAAHYPGAIQILEVRIYKISK